MLYPQASSHFRQKVIRLAQNPFAFCPKNHLLLTVAVRMPQLADDVRGVSRRGYLEKSENRAGKEKFVHG